MKNLIYQYWDGKVRPSCKAGVKNMKEYAKRIGADHIFEDNPQFLKKHFGWNFGSYSPHYGAFKPIYDESFWEYDNVLFLDTDVFAVEGLIENIFDEISPDKDLGICTEPLQPKLRTKTLGRISQQQDELWANVVEKIWRKPVKRTPEGLVEVYNTGVVLYTNKGLQTCRERFVPFQEYVNLISSRPLNSFYTCDQPYLHAMMFAKDLDFIELNNNWNSYIHYSRTKNKPMRYLVDNRTPKTKFVHIQFAGADNLNEDQLYIVTNYPPNEWRKWGIEVDL